MPWLLILSALALEPREDNAVRLRERLTTDFLHVGTEQGDSIPAGWRDDGLRLMKWADATVAHGWYLGVLALEVQLAERGAEPWASRDREALLTELHHALVAVDRLDLVAESAFPEPCASYEDRNGFFIRDDVPADYHTHFDGIDVVQSDFIDSPYLKEMSQDQVHHLNLGLLLTQRFVPAGVTVEGKELSSWAGELGARILAFVAQDDWSIRNPACDDKLVDRGGAAAQAAPGFSAIAAAFTDGELQLTYAAGLDTVWQSQSDPSNIIFENPDNLHMAMVTAALSDTWGDDTFDDLVAGAEVNGWWAYPLVHHALHDDTGHAELARVLDAAALHLDELGDSEPYTPIEGQTIEHGWTSWHRYIRPAFRHYTGEGSSEDRRNFGGDWLLLHHLVQLAQTPIPTVEPEPTASCGCQASPTGALLLWPLALLWRRRRAETRLDRTGP
jgi:hypothetical protein